MYQATNAYREQMEKPLRNASHVRITFEITDPDAHGKSTLTDNGHLYYSDVTMVDSGETAPYTYQTLEKNRFILDGKNPLPIEAGTAYQGFVGDEICKEDCTFEVNPTITITFADYFEFAGLTMTFDEYMESYPTEIQAIYKNDGVEVFNETFTPTETRYVSELHVPPMNEIQLIFKKMNLPYRRARISSLVYGLKPVFEAKDLVDCKYETESDVISSTLPKGDFDFTLFDTRKQYDPENPAGVWSYLEERQPVTFDIGYELDDGSIEWMPWGNTYSTGDVSVGKTGAVTEVTIKTKTLLGHLTQTYDKAVYSADGISLYDLAEQIMASAGFPNTLEIDTALKGVMTMAPISALPVNQCLQLIANAGLCIMGANRDGTPYIRRPSTTVQDFIMDFSKMFETPTTTKYPLLKDLITEYRQLSVAEAAENVVSDSEITDAAATDIEFTHEAITGHEVTVGDGLTLNASTFYAYRTVLNLTGSGKVTISGKKIKENIVKYTKHCNDVGEDLEVSNQLITSYEWAAAYADWIAKEMARRNEYETTDRGYPEIDVGDNIKITTNFENETAVTVLKRRTEFNGGISGSGKYLIGGGS